MSKPESVVIDGVRYVPLQEVQPPSLEQIRAALKEIYWGSNSERLQAEFPNIKLYVEVVDDVESGGYPQPTVDEFIEQLALRLTKESAS